MSYESDEELGEDTYNLEALWLKKLLSIWTDLNIPARLVALRTPNQDTILEWGRVLDSVMSILELSKRINDKEIKALYGSYNKCLEDSFHQGRWSSTPLRKFEGKLARTMANKRFFTMGGDYVDDVEGPDK